MLTKVPGKVNRVNVCGVHVGSRCDWAGFHFMDNSTQLVDTNQHIVSDSHPNVVSRGLRMKEEHDRQIRIKHIRHSSFCILGRRHTHIPVAQVENKEVAISAFVLASLTSVVGLWAIVSMAIEKQFNHRKCFYVFEVSRRTKLHVTFSVENSGNWNLREVTNYCLIHEKDVLSDIDYLLARFLVSTNT